MLNEKVTSEAIRENRKADTLIIVGTSLTVYPAAYYIEYFKEKSYNFKWNSILQEDDIATLVIMERFAQVMTEVMNILK